MCGQYASRRSVTRADLATQDLEGLQAILSRSHPAKNRRLRTNEMTPTTRTNTYATPPRIGAHLDMFKASEAEHVGSALSSLHRRVALRPGGAVKVCGRVGMRVCATRVHTCWLRAVEDREHQPRGDLCMSFVRVWAKSTLYEPAICDYASARICHVHIEIQMHARAIGHSAREGAYACKHCSEDHLTF